MASRAQDNSRIVSARLPDDLIRRLDRYLDWRETSGRVKFSRNAALRKALRLWLDDQEQLAGFVSPEILRGQFRTAYDQVNQGYAWGPSLPPSPTTSVAPGALRYRLTGAPRRGPRGAGACDARRDTRPRPSRELHGARASLCEAAVARLRAS
jgi:Predicted transcriptional regulators containing the CopG/Arc/MetJ DNA-binding domain and a metal-binding domain